ncbi:MAG: Adenine specific DNA methyltransferase [Promethearchaeota archaeon CR_4]|nr:MAG: Adenine specific DNA methyltransferase [Candidatus Lokiarchaeota archaeon CR_4]
MLFVRDIQQLKAIVKQGRTLIDAHLLRTSIPLPKGIAFNGHDKCIIKKQHIRYDPVQERLFINENEYWKGITSETWDSYIGGWPVLSHWLSERDGQKIGDVGQQNFERILRALIVAQDCVIRIKKLLAG